MKALFILFALSMSMISHASSYFDSANKIEAALNSKLVANSLKNRAIESVKVQDLYVTILTDSCSRTVLLERVTEDVEVESQYQIKSLTMQGCR